MVKLSIKRGGWYWPTDRVETLPECDLCFIQGLGSGDFISGACTGGWGPHEVSQFEFWMGKVGFKHPVSLWKSMINLQLKQKTYSRFCSKSILDLLPVRGWSGK